MGAEETVRVWKDRRVRRRMSAVQRAALPESPAGPVELSDERIAQLGGGVEGSIISVTLPLCPTMYTGCFSITICPSINVVCVPFEAVR
jgi:mersacidin/lichenicidin family type 2 lantibiotic